MKTIFAFLIAAMLSVPIHAQTAAANRSFRAFDAKGNVVEVKQIVDALRSVDAVFLGEQHDDAAAHGLQLQILQAAFERYGTTRPIVLSLEMFERDAQIAVDEYLQDLINENNFVAASRAWNNYKTDYRPLVEFAKANKIAVVAANAPRRYVNAVARNGRQSLDKLSPTAKNWLAPLPYSAASDAYAKKFAALMGGMPTHNSNMLDSQSLWDATMADAINKALQQNKNALVIHLNGSFHSENRLGAPEHLAKYNPKARFVVVTMKPSPNFPNFEHASDENAGDFVILTESKPETRAK